MSDLNLTTFNPLYPMRIHQYNELMNDQNVNIMDKVNSIIDYLNQVGKLTNDVVKDWNTVYQWVMNDGLTTDVSNKIETMKSNGELQSLLTTVFTALAGDMTTLHTSVKDTIVNAMNEIDDLAKNNQTALSDNTHQSITTTFNSDGSITETFASGLIKITTFNSNGTITEVYSAPINKTKTITVNSDGSISEVVS